MVGFGCGERVGYRACHVVTHARMHDVLDDLTPADRHAYNLEYFGGVWMRRASWVIAPATL